MVKQKKTMYNVINGNGKNTRTITITNYLFRQNRTRNKGNINNTYKNTNITTFVPRRLHLKTSWLLAYNHL